MCPCSVLCHSLPLTVTFLCTATQPRVRCQLSTLDAPLWLSRVARGEASQLCADNNAEVCRAGRGPKRPRPGKGDPQSGAKKAKHPKSEQAWEQAQDIELDQSSIADLCRAQECTNNIVISDACERLRSGRMHIESSPVRRPQPHSTLHSHIAPCPCNA